jgi:acyl-CoA thioesterase-1
MPMKSALRAAGKSIVLLYFFLTLPAQAEKTLTIIGDSITEGYGVPKEKAYPALLEKNLPGWKITNAGISGSTSASAPSRMKWALKAKPTAVLIALGGNDGLRALKVEEMRKNLAEALSLAKKAGVKALLAGQQAPPNYGTTYTKSFFSSFGEVAKNAKVPLYPFILEGVAGNPKMNLADGIHPNEAGQQVIADKLLPFLKKELP